MKCHNNNQVNIYNSEKLLGNRNPDISPNRQIWYTNPIQTRIDQDHTILNFDFWWKYFFEIPGLARQLLPLVLFESSSYSRARIYQVYTVIGYPNLLFVNLMDFQLFWSQPPPRNVINPMIFFKESQYVLFCMYQKYIKQKIMHVKFQNSLYFYNYRTTSFRATSYYLPHGIFVVRTKREVVLYESSYYFLI